MVTKRLFLLLFAGGCRAELLPANQFNRPVVELGNTTGIVFCHPGWVVFARWETGGIFICFLHLDPSEVVAGLIQSIPWKLSLLLQHSTNGLGLGLALLHPGQEMKCVNKM